MHKGLDILADQAANRVAGVILEIETLERKGSDQKDFYDLPVWMIQRALKQAYKAGFVAAIGTNLEV